MESKIKLMLMSAVEIRAEIQSYLEKVQDESFLKAVHSMLDTYIKEQEAEAVVGYQTDGTAVTASVFVEQAEAAVASAKTGAGMSVEELEKQSEQWLARTK